MSKSVNSALIIILVLFLSAGNVCAINIYLNKFAYTYGSILRINDIALIQGGSQTDRSTISNLVLGTEVRKLSLIPSRLIKAAIEPYFSGSIIIIGSRTAVVPVDVYPDEYIWFYAELLRFIDSLDPLKNGRIEAEILSSFSIPESAVNKTPVFSLAESSRIKSYLSGEITVSYSFTDSNLSYTEKNILPMFFENMEAEKEYSNIYSIQNSSSFNGSIRIKINQYVPVSILRNSVIKGEQVTRGKIITQEMEISNIDGNYFDTSSESLDQYTYNKNLITGSLITYEDVDKIQLVKNGDSVQIYYSNKNIQITAPGEAYSSGSFGDSIRVKPDHSTEIFDCTVIGFKEVRIDLP